MKPFKYGCVVEADFFCPRPLLQNRLAEYVRDGQNVVLVGERRMGKTSLVFAVLQSAQGLSDALCRFAEHSHCVGLL